MARKPKLRGHKKGGGKGYRPRPGIRRSPGERLLIVCEGEKTEPSYFTSFRIPGLINVHVEGVGVSPPRLVDIALGFKRETSGRRGHEPYDQIWCVFDRDDWNESDFNSAISRAETRGLKVAYSNQAFELWYLLHFHYYNTPMHRKDYERRLSELLNSRYNKNAPNMFDQLRPRQETALNNASRLQKTIPERTQPETTPPRQFIY